jgi:5-formyltetrahydrofolate cyclo-ligase
VPGTIETGDSVAVMQDQRPVKQAMRARIRQERRQRDEARRAADARAFATLLLELPEVAAAGCVAAYASLPGEPDTTVLRQVLRASGRRVLLPVVLSDGHLDWAMDSGDLVAAAGVGGPEPTGPRLGLEGIGQADVVIVPALAVDTLGNRLGQGAGYYDRTLRLIDAMVPVLALVHESEMLDAAIEPIPVEPHDLPVDAVVTPHRYLRLPSRRRF